MTIDKTFLSEQIKKKAAELGFDACGFCRAERVDERTEKSLNLWLSSGFQAGMGYMNNYADKRCDPTLLLESARSVISLALNYYPPRKQPSHLPQIAYYAYGKDYHDVMKGKMQQLFDYIKTLCPDVEGRLFCDTAPVLERYWAAKAGIGFIGKNSMLIVPQKGSFFFLGELILNINLDYNPPLSLSCGTCSRCLDACPTKALQKPYTLNSNRCISYHTIENKGVVDEDIVPLLENQLYGCDICQQVCPWNRFVKATNISDFYPRDEILDYTLADYGSMSEEEYKQLFKGSAIKRVKYWGLKRNVENLKKSKSKSID